MDSTLLNKIYLFAYKITSLHLNISNHIHINVSSCKIPRMLPHLPSLRQLLHLRPGNRIPIKRPIQRKHNPRVRRLIKARSWDSPIQLDSATAPNLDIDALRVGLGAVGLSGRMQGNDFVPDDVLARCEVGDCEIPAEVVLDQVVGDPVPWVTTRFIGAGLDLGPSEGGWGYGAAVAVARGYVFLDWASVGDGPCVPLEGYFAAWLNSDIGAIALPELVADDICASKATGFDEAVVEVVCLPADSCRNGILIPQRSVPALIGNAIGNHLFDVTMSCHQWCQEYQQRQHRENVTAWGNDVEVDTREMESKRRCASYRTQSA